MIRFVLRLAAVLMLAGAIYLVVLAPTATVAQTNLLSKVSIQVGCSSVWSQETHHAKPAALLLDGHPLLSVPEAQSSCASASATIKHIAEGLVAGVVVLGGLSLLKRRRFGH